MCALTPRAKRSDRHRGVTPSCPFRHVCRMPQVSGAVPARHSLTPLQLSVSEAETYLSITWFRVRLLPAPRGDTAGRDRSLRRPGCRRARTRSGGAAQKVYLSLMNTISARLPENEP